MAIFHTHVPTVPSDDADGTLSLSDLHAMVYGDDTTSLPRVLRLLPSEVDALCYAVDLAKRETMRSMQLDHTKRLATPIDRTLALRWFVLDKVQQRLNLTAPQPFDNDDLPPIV